MRKPDWLKIKLPKGKNYQKMKELLAQYNLHTVCSEARCPNLGECWSRKTATFMILGDVCTRNCKFCAVRTGNPNGTVDKEEPKRIAQAVKDLALNYVVVTSVTRDDLSDGGAKIFAATTKEIKQLNPKIKIEVLIPDFAGNFSA
ncbi:MAG: lipoyl synthase, partial [bacterium]